MPSINTLFTYLFIHFICSNLCFASLPLLIRNKGTSVCVVSNTYMYIYIDIHIYINLVYLIYIQKYHSSSSFVIKEV